MSIRRSPDRAASPPRMKVAYIMSRFPRLTETFVLYEILEIERQGIDVEIYPLQRERARIIHPEAQSLVERARFAPWLSWGMAASHLHFLRRVPSAYFATLAVLIWANLGSFRFLAGAIAFFPKAVHFARQMQLTGVQHVHAHFASHPAAVAFVIHRLTGLSYSFVAHGSDLHRDRHMLFEKVSRAAFVVAISKYNRNIITSTCGAKHSDKVQVIHCGVDPDEFVGAARVSSSPRHAGGLQVICIGTLHEVKGQTHLIEACRLLQQQGLEFDCHLVGDGPDKKALQSQVENLGLSGRIQFHGSKTREEVVRLLERADVLVAPSVPTRDGRREGIPVVLMEAMASGVPVVASRLSGIPELVEHGVCGLLTPPGEAAAIATAIAELASDKRLAERLVRTARERIELDFNLRENAARLARCFSLARAA